MTMTARVALVATAHFVLGADAWAWAGAAVAGGKSSLRRSAAKMGMHREELTFARTAARGKMSHKSVLATQVVHKTAYWGTIKMGSPAQEFKVIFDTGSGNLILPAKSCNMPGCDPHQKYDPSSSSSATQVTNERGEGSTEISFGTGQISGDYYQDNFCIGDSTLCTDARFIAASQQTPEPFSQTPFDGILGMGFKDLSMGQGFNIVDDLNDSNQLPQSTFSVFLSDDGQSEMTFGGYKPEQLASDVVWSDVDRESYWQVSVDDITFNNQPSGFCQGKCQVAVDTGTSMLAGPSDMVDKLSSKVDAKDDCSNFVMLPTLGFKIGDRVLNLSPDDYMDRSANDCEFSLMALDVPPPKGPLFIFGDPFLRRFVTIYDRSGGGSGSRVGFAVANHEGMDAKQADQIISRINAGNSSSSSMSSSSKNAGADPKQVEVNLDSGMMVGDSAEDRPPPVHFDYPPKDDTAEAAAPSTSAAPSSDTDSAKPDTAEAASGSSDDMWAPKKFAKLSAVSAETKVDSSGGDVVSDWASKYSSWQGDNEGTTGANAQDAQGAAQGPPPVDDYAAEMKRLSSSLGDGVFVQKGARGHRSRRQGLVTIKLYKSVTKA